MICVLFSLQREGFSKFNKVYEFDYSLFGRVRIYIMYTYIRTYIHTYIYIYIYIYIIYIYTYIYV